MPPSAEAVIKATPAVVTAFGAAISALAVSSFSERLTDKEREEQEEEALRRSQHVAEMLEIVKRDEGLLGDLSTLGLGSAKPEAEGAGDDDGESSLKYEDFSRRCRDLVSIKPTAPELKEGVEWCGRLLLRELRIATKRTDAQEDLKFADGAKLYELLEQPEAVEDLARQAGQQVPVELREQLQKARDFGWRVRRTQQRKQISKAVKMILLARSTFPWVVASSAVSAVSTSISTMSMHYRAQALQSLQASTRGNSRDFKQATLAMILVEVIASLSRALEAQLNSKTQEAVAKSVQIKFFEALISKDMEWWSNQRGGWGMIMKVMYLPQQVKAFMALPRTFISRAVSVAIQIQLVRQKSSQMLYAMIVLHWARILMRMGLSWLQNRLTLRATRNLVIPSEDKFTWVHSLNPEHVQMFQSFARGPLEARDLQKFLTAQGRGTQMGNNVDALFSPLRSIVSQGGHVAEFSAMGSMVETGDVSITEAETIMHYASAVGGELESVYYDTTQSHGIMEPLATAHDYIAIPAKINLTEGIVPQKRATGRFKFEDVRFSYPRRKVEVLKGVNFEVDAGQVVGITGTTGCGKSTAFRLIERFYDVTSGRILLDGVDIRDYNPRWLRSQIVVVAQEPKLLPISIRENLVFGCSTPPSAKEIEQACRAACIWDALSDPQKFPNGLETQMEAVQNVAGGEKQRICIARAILTNPPILLLDEATSALDEVSQRQVQTALDTLMKGRTTFVIAHRLSTIKNADKILGFDNGVVVDDGTHEELLNKPDGLWRKLWDQHGLDKSSSDLLGASSPIASSPLTRSTVAEALSIQETTTTVEGMYAVLRQAVAQLAGTKEIAGIMRMIDDLEAAARSQKALATQALHGEEDDVAAVRKMATQWSKLRRIIRRAPSIAEVDDPLAFDDAYLQTPAEAAVERNSSSMPSLQRSTSLAIPALARSVSMAVPTLKRGSSCLA